MVPPFAPHRSFLDPLLTSDGKPYASERFNEIVKQCYLISKNCNTSYTDILSITPREREMLIDIVSAELKKQHDALKKLKKQKPGR